MHTTRVPHLGLWQGCWGGGAWRPSNERTESLPVLHVRAPRIPAARLLTVLCASRSLPAVQLSLWQTELCRSWEETGSCRYGAKCQVCCPPAKVMTGACACHWPGWLHTSSSIRLPAYSCLPASCTIAAHIACSLLMAARSCAPCCAIPSTRPRFAGAPAVASLPNWARSAGCTAAFVLVHCLHASPPCRLLQDLRAVGDVPLRHSLPLHS